MKTKPPLEKTIVAKIKAYMLSIGATFHKTHGGIYGERGMPDVVGTLPSGRAYFLEIKRPGRLATLTTVQRTMLQLEALHGAVAGAVTSVDEVEELLKYQGHPLDNVTKKGV